MVRLSVKLSNKDARRLRYWRKYLGWSNRKLIQLALRHYTSPHYSA